MRSSPLAKSSSAVTIIIFGATIIRGINSNTKRKSEQGAVYYK
jgi:hypothetical protein